MRTGPGSNHKLSYRKAHLHPLKKGKKYVISTTRDKEGKGQMAFIAFLFKGRTKQILLEVEDLLPGVKYNVEFKAEDHTSLLLTHWHKEGKKWVQLDSEHEK